MDVSSYYQILGVSKNASREQIKHAFRKRLLETHPDRNPQDLHAQEETRTIINAYRALTEAVNDSQRNATTPTAHACYTLDLSFTSAPPPFFEKLQQFATASAAVIVGLIIMFWMWQTVFGEDHLIFRPRTDIIYPTVTKQMPILVEPIAADLEVWYHTQRYQLSLAQEWMGQELAKIYLKSVEEALLQQDYDKAAFYRKRLEEIRDPTHAYM